MEDAAHTALLDRFSQHGSGIVLGVTGVHHQRKATLARGFDMRLEALSLSGAVRLVIVIIEPALPDRDDSWVPGRIDERRGAQIWVRVRFVRMDSDRGPDVGVTLCGRNHVAPLSLAGGDVEKGANASSACIVEDLFLAVGERQEQDRAQDANDHGGKVLRLRDDGSVPPDNPFVGRANHKPYIFTLGHRNQLGLALNPFNGEIWSGEQGPNGGDEINILRAGKNYGWPVVSDGRDYRGPYISPSPFREGMERPHVLFVPSIAISSIAFYTGDRFPNWRRNLFVGGMREGEIARTGQLVRIVFNDNWQELRREALLRDLHQRIRDVKQGPDGLLYVLTDEPDAAILRIEPLP